ncbi:MAG: hypothetical protein GY788_01510 [bacterium]|nr:hypothetical protein [bacterium]
MSPLGPLDFEQVQILEAYKSAYKSAIEGVNASCGKITTASFSLATAYGAVLALVKPKDEVAVIWVVLPFAGFALAALCGLAGHTDAISGKPSAEYDVMETEVTGTIDRKAQWAYSGLGFLVVAVFVAGLVTYGRYGQQTPTETSTEVTVQLSTTGEELVASLCDGGGGAQLTADSATVSDSSIELTAVAECGAADLTLASDEVRAIKTND